jgi:hypothetical protein
MFPFLLAGNLPHAPENARLNPVVGQFHSDWWGETAGEPK